MSKNVDSMKNALLKKRADTIKKVMDALQIMENEAISINFLSVFKFTGVSRSWLYGESEIKEIILKAKENSINKLLLDQATQLKVKEREIKILSKQNKMLRKQSEELKLQLEVAYAELYNRDE